MAEVRQGFPRPGTSLGGNYQTRASPSDWCPDQPDAMTSNALLRRMGRRGTPRLKSDRQQRYCRNAGVEFAAPFDHGQLRPDDRPRPRRPVGRRLDHQSPLRRRGRRPQPRRPRHTSHHAIVATDASRARCPADRDAAPRRLIGRRSGTELGVDRQATPAAPPAERLSVAGPANSGPLSGRAPHGRIGGTPIGGGVEPRTVKTRGSCHPAQRCSGRVLCLPSTSRARTDSNRGSGRSQSRD